jgi:hypothetical protein
MLWFRLTAARAVAPGHPERGDVPGWVLITGMTVALVMLIWGVASDALRNLITGFLSNISFGG